MSAEALAASKWQDRREAWESITNAADAETLTTHLAKETNGAVLDAALDAVARVAAPELAPALPYVVQKGLANARGATQRRGLRAVVALQQVAPSETTDALVDGITTSKNARGPSACAKALTTECAPSTAWLSSHSDRLATAVAKLASAANGDARKAAVDLAVAVDDPVVFQKLPENAKKAVAKLRGNTPPPPPPPEAGPPPPPGSPPKRVTIKAPPRKAPSPEKGDDLLAALARRNITPPFDAAFQGKWDARREKLEAVASVARACSGDGEALALAVAAACEAEPHAAVAKAAISACASVAGVAGVVGRRALVVALLPRLRDAKLASQASQALNDVSTIQPEVVFDDATVRAATDALAAGAKRRLPPQGRACGFRWASSAFAASSKAPPLSTKAWAALCAADCSDAHGPLRAAARDALSALCQRPRADVKSALQMLDAKTRAKVLERKEPQKPAAAPKRKPPPPKPQEVVVWPPPHITERTGTIAACDLAPTSLRATLRAPSEQRRAKALAELLKRAAGPGGGLDAREADADRVLRELRPLVGDARASLRAPACDCAAAWLDRVRNRDDARKLAAKTGLVVEAAAAVVDAGALTAYRAAALRLLQSCCGKRCASDDALVIDENGAKAMAKALQNASGAGAVALLTWLAKHADACDIGDALASPLITRLYDKARAPKDAALECVTALVQKGALDRSALETALDAAPIVGRRVVAQLLEGVFREASPIKVVKRVPQASPLPAAFDFGVADDASTPVVEAASPTEAFAAIEAAIDNGDRPALRAAAAAAAAFDASTFTRDTCGGAMRAAIAGARFAERDAAARASLDEVARKTALEAPRSSAIAAALDLLRGAPDRVVANHLARLLTLGLRDPAWGRALDARKGDALVACAEVFDSVSAEAPSLALDAAKTVAASAVDRIGSDAVIALSGAAEDSPLACLVRALAGAPPLMNVETSSPEQKPLAGVSDDVAALRRRAAAARASLGSARSVPDSAGKDRIAALRTRLAVAARTPAVAE
ncbi:unnamed protein product [Pelagomonas calceolata]|uniref:TOG domain-containing protein n=1 Tax=Pelagomonas calceolata TaxID=35677 RepID=A0A8J2SB71_9STRA|nr:unnamed protein product [Pelagomonas calceolata]